MPREVRGPGIAGIAMIAKPPPLLPPEHRIYELRRDLARRQEYADVLQSNESARRRAAFETNTERKIKEKRVEARVQQILGAQESALEARREKLRRLLASEEEEYAAGAASLVETPIEKMARMRQTVKTLREKRETERLQYSQEMQDEAWRANCDELRTATSRQEHQQVEEARRAQLAMKRHMEQKEAEVDQYYTDLWLQDAAAKEAREAKEATARAAVTINLRKELKSQMDELQATRQRERELKKEQQRLRLEEAALMEEERKRHLNDKHNAQARFRRTLERDAEARAAYASTHMDTEMQEDLDLLNKIEAEQAQAKADARAEKQKLAQETAEYHAYLRSMAEQRAAHEATFDAACQQEILRAQRKQSADWRARREKRRAMMDEVIKTRREQIRARQMAIEQERAENKAEGERIEADVKAFEEEEKKAVEKQAEFSATYGKALDEQIEADKRRREEERQALIEFEAKLAAQHRATDLRVTQELTSLLSINGASMSSS